MSNYSETKHTRQLAYKIVDKILYPDGIKTHKEYARRINQAGEIARMILKHQKEEK